MASPSADSATLVYQKKLYEDRWSSYGSNTGLLTLSDKLSVGHLKKIDLFQPYNDEFLAGITPDVSIAKWKAGSVLFEEGSYLDLAFYVVEGQVEVFLKKHQEMAPPPIFREEARMSPESAAPAEKTVYLEHAELQKQIKSERRSQEITMLATMDFDLARGESMRLGPGEIFGEIGALHGWPQSVTARTATDCTLVQIRLPALQAMKKQSVELKKRLDALYRERTLFRQLQTTPLFAGIDDPFIKELTERVELISCSPDDVITNQGEPADALYVVRSGFLRLSQKLGKGEAVVSYVSKGMTVGETELLIDGIDAWQSTTSSVGYSELVRIRRDEFNQILQRYPAVERRLWEAAVRRIKETGHTRQNTDKSELIEFSLMKGLVQGNSILVIDLDVCTRCDDCVRGCESTHGGRPRFVREGDKYENYLITRSCYHCEDPVCLIGCPTGAIQRANVGEVVRIEDEICIGCGNCANKCPYDAIVMHDTGETWPDSALPEWLRGRPRKVASKCDLCYKSDAGPACVNNCPHSCAFRISSVEDFQSLLETEHAQPYTASAKSL